MSLGSFLGALGVAGFIGVCLVHSNVWWSSGTFLFVGFNHACRRVHWVHSGAPWGSLASFGRALRLSGSFEFIGVIRVRPGKRHAHSRSFAFCRRALGVHSCTPLAL